MSEPRKNARKTILLYQEARGENLADQYRKGLVIELPAEGEAIIVGDIHGHQDNFRKVLALADLPSHPERHLLLQEVIHGGPTSDTGADISYRLLEAVAALKVKYPEQVHVILGNHDLAECSGQGVYKEGTLLNKLFHRGLVEAYGEEAADVKEAMKSFIRSLPLACKTQSGVFISHSTPSGKDLSTFNPGVFAMRELTGDELKRGGSAYALVWGRDFDSAAADEFAEMVGCATFIISHDPCPEGYCLPPNGRHVVISSYTEMGCYLRLPLEGKLTQQEMEAYIRRIGAPAPS